MKLKFHSTRRGETFWSCGFFASLLLFTLPPKFTFPKFGTFLSIHCNLALNVEIIKIKLWKGLGRLKKSGPQLVREGDGCLFR